jgi:hypothetical protein
MRTCIVSLGMAGLAALAAGCLGAAAPHAPGHQAARTHVVVRHPVRGGTRRRTLTCDPDRGGYRDPAAACRALRDLAWLARHPRGVTCACRTVSIPNRTIAGRIDGARVRLALGACSPCALGGRSGADMRVLFVS